ncbi:MAG: nitrite reductase [Vibrio sp.]|uniref:TPR domain-containing protein n=1 Tax=Vibrio sp. TaxID=678 RepID=UPI003A876D97
MKSLLAVALIVSVPVYGWLLGDKPQPTVAEHVKLKSSADIMTELQQQLRADPNQADLWFQLGQGYLFEQDFSAATTCFDYAIRLSESPSANQLSGKASAIYYQNKQRLTPEIEALLTRALSLDANNLAALTLLASDHFISFRYQQAIDLWVQILDSNQPEVDRRKTVVLLNQAKALLEGRRS